MIKRQYLLERVLERSVNFPVLVIAPALGALLPVNEVQSPSAVRARETMTKEWRKVTIDEFQVKMFPDSGIVSRDAINS